MKLYRSTWAILTLTLFVTSLLVFSLWILREASTGIPVLNYHQINDEDVNALTVPTAEFAREMDYLAENGYHTITPKQLTDYLTRGTPLPAKPILITFDDGYLDNYVNAYPILKERGMVATIFLVSDYMGRFDKYLTWDQVVEMSEAGFSMESHTLSHFELPPLSPDQLHQQLEGGKLATQWHTLQYTEYIAYPCGTYNQQVLEAVKDCGYRGGFTVRYDLVHKGDNPYLLSRVPIFGHNTHSFEKFKTRIQLAPLWGRLERLRDLLVAHHQPFLASLIWLP